jgi:hypothetical protein
MSVCKNGLHDLTPDNLYWKVDKRHAQGGSNVCLACFKENHRAASERRRQRSRMYSERRYDKVRGRKYRGPNQLVDDAASEIISLEVSGADALRVAESYATTIAAGRLRFTRDRDREPTLAEVAAEVDRILEAANKLSASAKKNPLAHLNVKPDAERAWDRFNKALEEARLTGENVPNCQDNPAPYADYDDEEIPSAEEAHALCFDCPLIALCSSYAEQERPAWGVWSGEPWAYGEIVNNE